MSVHYNENAMEIEIPVTESDDPISSLDEKKHLKLLNYLLYRLKKDETTRNQRIHRYARIDKSVSTWMKLTKEEANDASTEAITGRGRAIPINLPLLATHLDDMAAYFSDIFAPLRQNYYETPTEEDKEASQTLTRSMNRDAKARQYYMEVNAFFRSILKYNTAGFTLTWEQGNGLGQLQEPGNRVTSIDMYNVFWDPTVIDMHKVSCDAEWAAIASHENHTSLVRKALRGELANVDKVSEEMMNRYGSNSGLSDGSFKAEYYRLPPTAAGLSIDGVDSEAGLGGVDWSSYGAGLPGEGLSAIQGHEVITMYCRLNPLQFGLVSKEEAVEETDALDEEGAYIALWKFIIVDSKYICAASPVQKRANGESDIPIYLGHLTRDDMRAAQRSVMELMKPFQSFGSFLMNTYQAGARKAIWGVTGIDPSMFDSDRMEKGDVVGLLKSKVPGRDVRTGIMAIEGRTGTENAMQMLMQLMQLVQLFFPSQALPAQVASIDRAVKDQVAAVTQGSVRRLHAACRVVDDAVFQPLRLAQYWNIAMNEPEGIKGITEEAVASILGSGLQQMNAEVMVSQLKELIFAILQNQEATQKYDVSGLFDALGRAMNLPVNLGDFVREAEEATQLTAADAAAQEGVMPGANGGGSMNEFV